ncbi:hypothetical protein ACQP2U_34260 [Nocardia sp. CA-084685]|uniref:hypothetical protein n=1 Tax=Nocardia sp. CA-084685 TaxID=3239970 RepID=UPI003D9526FF
MRRDMLRTTRTRDGDKIAVWQLVSSSARVLRVQFPRESFTAHRLPSRTPLPDAQSGTILFDVNPDLADARELLPAHDNLWDVLRNDYWTALLCAADLPNPLGHNADE